MISTQTIQLFIRSLRKCCLENDNFDTNIRQILNNLNSEVSNRLLKELIYENHAGYALMLMPSITERIRVLYIGRVEGGMSVCIGAHGHEMFVCDPQYEKLFFILKRARALDLPTVHCINVGSKNLPFKKNSFNLIVFEVESFEPEMNIGENIDIELEQDLRGCQDLLKSNGQWIIMAGNRFSFRRLIAVIKGGFCAVKQTPGCRERQVLRILKDFGFNQIYCHGIDAETGYFWPLNRSPNGLKAARSMLVSGHVEKKNFTFGIKAALTKNRFFTPSFGIVASKKPTSLVWEEILMVVFEELRKNPLTGIKNPVVQSILNRKTQRIMIRITDHSSSSLAVLTKIPYGKLSKLCDINNFKALQALHGDPRISAEIKKLVPRPIFKSTIGEFEIYVESFLNYDSQLIQVNSRKIHKESYKFIFDLHCQTLVRQEMSGSEYSRLVETPLKAIESLCHTPSQIRSLQILRRYLEINLAHRTIPLVFVHGDYSQGNLLVNKSQKNLAGVIDWEMSDPKGLPALDLFFLLFDLTKKDFGLNSELIRKLLTQGRATLKGNYWIEKYLHYTNLSTELLPALIVLHWATQVAFRGFSIKRKYDAIWLDRNIYRFIQGFSEIVKYSV